MIQSHSHTIADLAFQVGIDFNKVADRLYYETNGRPISGRIAIDKEAAEGNPYVFVNAPYIDNKGNKYPNITFGTHAHGGFTVNFNGYREAQADRPVWIDYPKPKPIIKPIAPLPDNKWRIKKFETALTAFNLATNEGVDKHPYIVRKSVNVTGCDIRLVNGLLQYPIQDIDGNITSFQTIDGQGKKRFIGSTSGGFMVIGNKDMVQFGLIPVEGLATGLSTFHSKTLNPLGLPVVVCLDAGNMRKVVAAFVEKYGADIIHLYADNDCGLNSKGEFTGNTGVFTALEICQQHGIPSYRLPVMDGEKCDFNDTEEFMDVEVPTGVDYTIELIAVAPKQSVNKLIWQYAYQIIRETRIDAKTSNETAHYFTISEAIETITSTAFSRGLIVTLEASKFVKKMVMKQVARQFAYQVPAKLSIKRATDATIEELEKYGVTSNRVDIETYIKKDVKRRSEVCRYLNKITDFRGIKRHNVDDYAMAQITERIDFENSQGGCGNLFIDTRGMGQGKTRLMAARIKNMRGCAYITHRVSLIIEACRNLDLDNYRDNDIYADRIALCINSLLKFAEAVRGKPLFIDEARQVYDTLINCATIDDRCKLMKCFIDILKSAPSIHLADAGMNDEALAFYRKHCGGKNIHVIETTVTDNPANHWNLESLDACRYALLKDLHHGKRGLVGCTSELEAQKTRRFLVKNGIKAKRILVVTGNNKGNKDVAAFIANVNEVGKNYDVIIYTSVLGSGVSIEIPEFEFTYLLCSNILASNESLQMLARNRCAKDVYVGFGNQLRANRVTNVEVFRLGQIEKVKNFADKEGVHFSDKMEFIFSDLDEMIHHSKANLNRDLNDFENNFLLLAELEGRHFIKLDEVIEKITGLKEEVTQEKVAEIQVAPIADKHQYKLLKKTHAITSEQSASIKRYEVCEMTGILDNPDIPPSEEAIKHYLKGDRSVLANFELLDTDTNVLKKLDIENYEKRSKPKSLCSRQKIFKALLRTLTRAEAKDGIEPTDLLKASKVLEKHYAELAAEFGNYQNISAIRIGRTVGNFLNKFGYKLVSIRRVSQGKRHRIYEIKPIEHIERYALNRKGLSG